MEYLERDGVFVTRPLFFDGATLSELRRKLDSDMGGYQEFKGGAKEYVMGGFKAMGNPSSFHSPTVRYLRATIYQHLAYELSTLHEDKNLEMLIDRLTVREAGTSATAESWHRDESPSALPDDIIYGGWINLNDTSQYFSCVPGEFHTTCGESRRGFAKIPKDMHIEMKSRSIMVEIPPGCMIIFNQTIIHEVLAKKLPYKMYRLYVGWRFTSSDVPLVPNLNEILDKQGVVPLKSGQMPPMHAKLHWVNWIDKLKDFTKCNIRKRCTVKRERRLREGDSVVTIKIRVVDQFLKSLEEYGFQKYDDYCSDERQMHMPIKLN